MIRLEDIPEGGNGEALKRMRIEGDSLTLTRAIDFSVVFPQESAALAFCDAINEQGLTLACGETGMASERFWDVTVTRNMVPDHAAITAMERWLAAVAEPFGGENDGWGCFNMQDLQKT